MTGHMHILDASGMFHRSYHINPDIKRADGVPVGAVMGFATTMWSHLTRQHTPAPTHMVMAFDHRGGSFRDKAFQEYKGNRPEKPDDLRAQMPLFREAAVAMGLPVVEVEGFEADDVIATLARQAVEAGMTAKIYSSDKDMMQLITYDDAVVMHDIIKSAVLGYEETIVKFGVPPHLVTHVQALSGDTADNVPGVPGIGVKIAAGYVREYGDLEGVLAADIPGKRGRAVKEFAEQALASFEMVKLCDDVPLPVTIDDLKVRRPSMVTMRRFFRKNSFETLQQRSTYDLDHGRHISQQEAI